MALETTSDLVISVLAGVLAGALHVLSGPDHLAAVAPLSLGRPFPAWRTGFRWGLGHCGGVLLVGVVFLQVREAWPAELFSAWAEQVVGATLIGIGLWGLRTTLSARVHAHEHVHEGHRHLHIHAHHEQIRHDHAQEGSGRHAHSHAAFAVGTLHGLAGSSHLLGVVPAMAFPTQAEGLTYLAAYGAGTILAMTAFSSAIGWLGRNPVTGTLPAHRALMMLFSVLAVGVGVYWLGA